MPAALSPARRLLLAAPAALWLHWGMARAASPGTSAPGASAPGTGAPAPASSAEADRPPIAAAADLQLVMPEITERFRRESGRSVRISFGSSGNFTQQIEHGAPFQLFLSADERFVQRLVARGLTEGAGTPYAIGRLVLFAPRGATLQADPSLDSLRAELAADRIRRFAIANPEHAPYGRAARAALQDAGLWAAIEPKLVYGENAAQAMQFAASGSTQGGLVPLALAMAPELAGRGAWAEIPAARHQSEPLRQRMVLLRGAGATARAFHDFLGSSGVRQLLARRGFFLP